MGHFVIPWPQSLKTAFCRRHTGQPVHNGPLCDPLTSITEDSILQKADRSVSLSIMGQFVIPWPQSLRTAFSSRSWSPVAVQIHLYTLLCLIIIQIFIPFLEIIGTLMEAQKQVSKHHWSLLTVDLLSHHKHFVQFWSRQYLMFRKTHPQCILPLTF